MIATLLALVLVAAPARGNPGDPFVPLVHVTGWYSMGQDGDSLTPTRMSYADPAADEAFTLPAGSWVRVWFAGSSCRVDGGPAVWSTRLHAGMCYGYGPVG